MLKKKSGITMLVYALLLLIWPATASGAEVLLTVKERFGVDRKAAPVTYGVPFSREDNLLSTDSLYIPDTKTQFRVLSRYEGTPDDETRPIRVVLVDFQTDIKASETRQFSLRRHDGPLATPVITRIAPSSFRTDDRAPATPHSNQPASPRPNLASETRDYVMIDTGAAQFRISKTRGNLFDQVLVNGSPIIQSPRDDGFHIVFNGQTYSSSNIAPFNVEIEENGPLRCVVKLEGEFVDAAGRPLIPPVTRVGTIPETPLRYTVRYFAYKDKGHLKLQVTLRNENKGWTYQPERPVHNIHITEAYLKTTLNGLAQTKTVAFDGYTDTFTSGTYALLQREVSDGTKPLYDWQYAITRNGQTVTRGEQYDSYVNLRDSSKGLMVANRWFWQNHPIGVTVHDNELHMNLWPDARDYLWPPNDGTTHRILGGIWKTHEILYSFHGPDTEFDQELAHIKKRLIARCSDEHYADTNFFNFIVPEKIIVDHTFQAGETLQPALDRNLESYRSYFVDSFIQRSDAPHTLFDIRDGRRVLLRRNPNAYATWYGWLEFGGMPRAENFGYHNQHYDWSFFVLNGFLRFSDYDMFELAEELLRHKADILVIHDPDATPQSGQLRYEYHGGQRYEQDALFSYNDDYGPYHSGPRRAGHFWTNGLTLQYLLTGESLYFEAVKQCYDHILRVKDFPPMRNSETRNSSRGIDALVNGYALTGQKEYLDAAYQMFLNNLLEREGGRGRNDGVSGWIQSGRNSDGVHFLYEFIQSQALIGLYFSLCNAGMIEEANNLKKFLYRWAYWARTTLLTRLPMGQYRHNMKEYFPFRTTIAFSHSEGISGSPTGIYINGYRNLFMFMYLMSDSKDNGEWLNLARHISINGYYRNQLEWQPVSFGYSRGQAGLPERPRSGTWKFIMNITGSMFYFQSEYFLQKKN